MAQLRAANGSAMAVLFDRYHRLVFRIALRILRDVAEAEDVTQGVFLEIYRAAAQFDQGKGSAKVWIIQYAFHRSLNRRKQLIVRNFYTSNEISEVGGSAVSLVGRSPSPLTKLLVQESLQTLNSAQRRVLELAHFEGLSLKEIAEQRKESLGNVRHHYYRGLKKLRAFLTKKGGNRLGCCQRAVADANA